MRHRKNDVVVLNRQGCGDQFLDPKGLFYCKAFWAMSVATAIVAISDFTAMVACLFMSAQRSRTALQDIVKHLCLLWRKLIFFNQLTPKPTDYLRKFKFTLFSFHKAYLAGCVVLCVHTGPHASKSWWWLFRHDPAGFSV